MPNPPRNVPPYVPIVLAALLAVAVMVGLLRWQAGAETRQGVMAEEMNDAEFIAFKERQAPALAAALSAATPETPKAPASRECIIGTGMDALSRAEVAAFYRTGQVPVLNRDKLTKSCIATVPKDTPYIFGTELPAPLSDSDKRYYVLQKLQKICNNDVATRYGKLEVRGRNYCACIATRELATMKNEDVPDFEKSGHITLDKTQQDDMVKECTGQ